MVKSLKHIIVRVIIGVLIALILMYLKGGLIADVSAKTTYSWSTQNNTNFGSCSNCRELSYTYSMFTQNELKNKDGYAYFSVAFYSTPGTGEFIPVMPTMRVTTSSGIYNCNLTSAVSSFTLPSGQQNYVTESYSATCPVNLGSSGITNIQIYVLGANTSGSGISFYSPATFVLSDSSEISSAIEDNTQATNDLNDSITSEESPDDSDIEGVFDFGDDSSSSPVSDLITLPITLLESFNNGFSSSCSPFNLGSLYGHSISLPCIDMKGLLGDNLWGLIDMCFSLFLVYNIGLMCISIYESITSLEDGFRSLYTPKHNNIEYEPKHGGGS